MAARLTEWNVDGLMEAMPHQLLVEWGAFLEIEHKALQDGVDAAREGAHGDH